LRPLRKIGDSYRARLIVGYLLVAAVFSAAWLWSLYGPVSRAVLSAQERDLKAVAQTSALYAAETTGSPQATAKHVDAVADVRVTIVRADGAVLADSRNDPATMDNHSSRPEVSAALRGETGVAKRLSKTDGAEELYIAVPTTWRGDPAVLRISQPIAEIGSITRESRQLGLILLFVAIAIAAGIATWASGAAAKPIRELSSAAESMAAGDLEVDVPDVPADLVPLAKALTVLKRQMRARLTALESEQKTLRTALNGLSDAVFLLEGGTIRYANSAAGRIFRMPRSGWRDAALFEVGLPESLVGSIAAHLGSTKPFAAELDSDPLGRTLRIAVIPLDQGSDDGRALVVVSDVTERARLDRVRRDFVANASHELKTPVAGIQLLAESAGNAAADGDVEQSLLFSAQIREEAVRLERLVRDLLDLSRLETAAPSGEITDIRQSIENAVVSHRAAANRSGLTLDVDLSAIRGVDVFAAAERTDVAVALDNLLDNAIAYTEVGGASITVTVTDTAVRIMVADTGTGIPAEDLPRIFERFYRVDRARSRESGGTGLGLALVRHVVERSGGTVVVASEEGVGTTFTVSLNRAV
jgi:two-component system, OmpR family, phosphate regulon sensor histidine kinase PhoR